MELFGFDQSECEGQETRGGTADHLTENRLGREERDYDHTGSAAVKG